MSRININKQLELSAASRSVIVTDVNGRSIFEGHDVALVADLDIDDWPLIDGATVIDANNDYLLLKSATENQVVKIPVSAIVGLVGGGGGSLYSFENGITESGGVVKIGGSLTGDTLITGNGFSFSILPRNFTVGTDADMLLQTRNAGTMDLLASGDLLIQGSGAMRIISNTDGIIEVGSFNDTIRISDVYDLAVTAPDATSGAKSVMVWTGNGSDAGPGFEPYVAGGGGGGSGDGVVLLWQDIAVDAAVAERFLVRCTDPTGVTLTKPSATEFLVTVPTGVEVTDLAIHLSAGNNPGTDVYVRIDFQGNGYDGLPREVYGTEDTVSLPSVRVANKALADMAGAVSRSNYIKYGVTQGSGALEVRMTGVQPLELYLVNFNQANSAGNGAAIITISDL